MGHERPPFSPPCALDGGLSTSWWSICRHYFGQNLEEINVLRITLDTQIEDLEQHFETAHINYLQVRVAPER